MFLMSVVINLIIPKIPNVMRILATMAKTWQQNDKMDMLDFPVFAGPRCS